jgi:hypothetical protein
MSRYWVCDCCACSPDLKAAGVDYVSGGTPLPVLGQFRYDGISASCPLCTVYVVRFVFATEPIARALVGEGNYSLSGGKWLTDEWVLFGDGTTYARPGSKPVPCVITSQEIPASGGTIIPMSVNLKNGAYIWTRQSSDPTSADFVDFDMTFPTEIDGGGGYEYCVGIQARTVSSIYFYESASHPPSFTATFAGCDPIAFTACLENDSESCTLGGLSSADGWCALAGGWGYADDTDPNCFKYAVLSAAIGTAGGCPSATISVSAGPDCPDQAALTFDWAGCTHDARECPTEADFDLVWDFDCPAGELSAFDCDDCSGGSGNCPPEECPASYCKWQWDTTTHSWDLVSSNCISPAECPDPPADPTVMDVAWVECNCCTTPTPDCSCDEPLNFEPCDTQDCVWWWQGAWELLTACSDITCECHAKPDDITDPGGFIGETRDGCCCIEI